MLALPASRLNPLSISIEVKFNVRVRAYNHFFKIGGANHFSFYDRPQ